MKIYLSDINKIEWLKEVLPFTFLSLAQNKTLLFGYHYEKEALSISDMKVVDVMNDIFYKDIQDEHLGFLKEPFDSDSALFYYFLLTFAGSKGKKKELLELFLSWKAIDLDRAEKLPISVKNGKYAISNLATFETAIKNYIINPRKIPAVLKITESLDGYFKRKHGVSFYGGVLKEIVMAMSSPMSGFIPEYNGEMRYMIVGENANLSEEEKEALQKARFMFRDEIDEKKIWYETGWYINTLDGKWRKRISDENFHIKNDGLEQVEGCFVLNPHGKYDIQELVQCASNDEMREKLNKDGYDGKISDVLSHEELFKYYPQIQDLKLFFGMFPIKNPRELSYFFSNEEKVLCFRGTIYREGDEKILLHEMQHYIQYIEGFASGGNPFISQIVSAIGGQYVKSFIFSYNNMTIEFVKHQSEIDYKKINEYAKKIIQHFSEKFKNNQITEDDYRRIVGGYNGIEKATQTQHEFYASAKYIAEVFGSTYSSNFENRDKLMADDIQRFFKTDLGMDCLLPFMNEMRDIITRSEEYKKSMGRTGWSEKSLELYFHYAYKGLLGEMESRDVQQSSTLPKELMDYILPYTTETIEHKFYSVLTNNGMPPEGDVYAAIETLNPVDTNVARKQYVIHLLGSGWVQFFLHEIGHIVFDILEKEPLAIKMQYQYTQNMDGFDSFEHYFIEHFLCYLVRKNIDEEITKEFQRNKYVEVDTYDSMFDNMFYSEVVEMDIINLQKGLDYVKKLREPDEKPKYPVGEKNLYFAAWRNKKMELRADTIYQAQEKAAKIFGAKKSYELSTRLIALGDEPVPFDTMI